MIRLYKYRPYNDHLESIIVSQKIWFPARAKLNDSEDLELSLINDVNGEIYHQFLQREAAQKSWPRKLLKYNLRKGITPTGNLTSEAMRIIASSEAVLQRYFDGLGILSLSDNEDSPILWERYGDQGQGVCITFKMELSEHLLRVEYTTPRPQLKLSNLLLSADAEGEILKILKTKTTKWSDESEWRYFIRKGNTEFSFLGTVEAVKLGKKMSGACRQRIVEWVAKSKKPISIEE
jgi:hypothetical protein